MEALRRCGKCRKEKVSEDFREGRKTCIACLEQVSQYQKNNPDKINEKNQRYYDRKKEEILEQKREKIWCKCCRVEVRKQGWQNHITSYKHKHHLEVEAGDMLVEQGKVWCDICRVSISKKAFSQHKTRKGHLRLKKLMDETA